MAVTLDYLPKHPDIKIYQDSNLIKINSDTELLGEFLEVYKNDTVIDFGTNTGALLLYANLYKPKKLIGLEIDSKALELAKKNMELNNITNYELVNADILTYTAKPVDVIICNPPYFKTEEGNKGDNSDLARAKHEGSMSLEGLILSISRNLIDNGTLYLLYTTPRLVEVISLLEANNLRIKEMKFCFDEKKEYSNVFMVKAIKNGKNGLNVVKPFIKER